MSFFAFAFFILLLKNFCLKYALFFFFFNFFEVFGCSELARVLGEKGVIVFSDVEHVILKSTFLISLLICLFPEKTLT